MSASTDWARNTRGDWADIYGSSVLVMLNQQFGRGNREQGMKEEGKKVRGTTILAS